jgi:isoquinoline 1-oxidoreductase beta subunit
MTTIHASVRQVMSISVSRRNFVKTVAGLSFAVSAGSMFSACSEHSSSTSNPSPLSSDFRSNIWVTIGTDDSIEIICPATELGQGSMTSLPMILAEELDADWARVKIKAVTRHDPAYGNPDFGGQLFTAGQASVESYYNILRFAGAQARRVLLDTAASHWTVPVNELMTRPSLVVHEKTGRSLSFGALAAIAEVPDLLPEIKEGDLKPRSHYRIVGKQTPRLDIPEKVDGRAIFGIDIQVPDMLYGMVARPPVEGATAQKIDQSEAEIVAGFITVVPLDYGVGIVCTTMDAVLFARNKLRITWSNDAPASAWSSENTLAEYQTIANDLAIKGSIWHERGDVKKAMQLSTQIIEAAYQSDYAYHAQLEPMNATATVGSNGDTAEIWVSTQTQTLTVYAAAKALGTSHDKIIVHPTYVGGGFGRRTHMQYVEDAVLLSKATGKPVKVTWTREDDIKNGLFRPLSAHQLRAGLNQNGHITSWHHRVATPSVLAYFKPERWSKAEGLDVISMKSTENSNYNLPNMLIEHLITERQARIVPYRGIGAGYNKFAIESFLDEIALARQMDPLALRMELCVNSSRMLLVLEELARLCEWDRVREGTALGISVAAYGETMAAGVAEVSLDQSTGVISVHNFWTVVDPGLVIAPDNSRAQMEGAIIFGLSHVLKERITIKDGEVQQSNYHDYPILRMSEIPAVQVKLLSTDNPPSGIGETGVPLTGAAVANALAALTGLRLRHLPLTPRRVLAALDANEPS